MDSKRSYGPLLLAGALALASAALVPPARADRPHEGHEPGQGPGQGPDPAAILDRMTTRLELEDDQVDLLREVLEARRERAREIRRNTDADRRSAMEVLREETDARLAGILTPAQMQTLEETRDEHREARRSARSSRREARFERLADRLELADGQRETVREILAASMARGQAAMAQARAGGADRNAVRAQMETIRADTRNELAAILTPAQLEQFDALREQRPDGRGQRRRPRRGGPPRGR